MGSLNDAFNLHAHQRPCFEVRAHIGLVRVTGKVDRTDVADPFGASLRGWSPVL